MSKQFKVGQKWRRRDGGADTIGEICDAVGWNGIFRLKTVRGHYLTSDGKATEYGPDGADLLGLIEDALPTAEPTIDVPPPHKQTVDSPAILFLKQAARTIASRGQEYDRPEERSMGRIVAMFNAGRANSGPLTEMDGWLFQCCLKMVRLWTAQEAGKFHLDSGIDLPAYGALAAEAGQRRGSRDPINTENKQ